MLAEVRSGLRLDTPIELADSPAHHRLRRGKLGHSWRLNARNGLRPLNSAFGYPESFRQIVGNRSGTRVLALTPSGRTRVSPKCSRGVGYRPPPRSIGKGGVRDRTVTPSYGRGSPAPEGSPNTRHGGVRRTALRPWPVVGIERTAVLSGRTQVTTRRTTRCGTSGMDLDSRTADLRSRS